MRERVGGASRCERVDSDLDSDDLLVGMGGYQHGGAISGGR
jgi:hypothetical protein